MKRRTWVAVGVGAAAAAAGAAWSLLRLREAEPLDEGFWQLRFAKPDGGELQLAAFRGKPLLLNFWATWCPPCIKEMPALDQFQRQQAGAGWQVVGLAVDNPAPVRHFLARQPVSFAIGIAGFEGTEVARRLGNANGLLPFTAVFDAKGLLRRRKLGETKLEELTRWARDL